MKKYTVYVVEVKNEINCFQIYVRYKQIMQLHSYLKKSFKTEYVPDFGDNVWMNTNDPAVIEDRKKQIQAFLYEVLNNRAFKNKSILEILGIPLDFLKQPED